MVCSCYELQFLYGQTWKNIEKERLVYWTGVLFNSKIILTVSVQITIDGKRSYAGAKWIYKERAKDEFGADGL